MKKTNLFNYLSATILLLSTVVSISCEEKEIPPPTLNISSTQIDLGELELSEKFSIVLNQKGEGKITYKIKIDKDWFYSISKKDSLSTTNTSNSLDFVYRFSNSLKIGENIAQITIIPEINGVEAPSQIITVKVDYNPPIIKASVNELNLGDVKDFWNGSITLSNIGNKKVENFYIQTPTWLTASPSTGSFEKDQKINITYNYNQKVVKGNNTDVILIYQKSKSNTTIQSINIPLKLNYLGTNLENKTGYTLTKNEVWSGNINVLGNIIIPENITLTISPGTNLAIQCSLSDGNTSSGINIKGKLEMLGKVDNLINVTGYVYCKGIVCDGGEIIAENVLFKKGDSQKIKILNSVGKKNQKFYNCFFSGSDIDIEDSDDNYEMANLTFGFGSDVKMKLTKGILKLSNSNFYNNFDGLQVYNIESTLKIENSNFYTTNNSYNILIYSYSNLINNLVEINNCYNLNKTFGFEGGPGADGRKNILKVTNPSSSPISNAGCSWEKSFSVN